MSQSFRVNRQIRAPEVRLIDAEGTFLGVLPTDDARRKADEVGLDLVEVQPMAVPPVCKILDFGKFKYELAKKERGGAKKNASQLKELRVRPAIDKHDLEYRLVQGRGWLMEGHKVQVVCVFRGRQMAHPQIGMETMRRVIESLADISKVESHPKMMGNRMNMLLARK